MTNIKMIALKDICKEHKLCPRISRMLLRDAVKDNKKYPNLAKQYKPRNAWEWLQGSKEHEEALKVLKPVAPQKVA